MNATLQAVGCNAERAFPTIIEEFCQRVAQSPEAIAVVFEETQFTFRQLDELASRLANALCARGVTFGDTVGLCIERRPEAIASMLAAFKIGAAFVPLDPDYPADRIGYMIRDAAIRVIITFDRSNHLVATKLAAATGEAAVAEPSLAWIDCAEELSAYSDQFEATFPTGDDLAYIMYTSGSTGMPKGVQIEHRALATYCLADREVYCLTASDRTLQFSTLNFDIAIEEIFPPLLVGGTVVIRPQGRSSSHNELSSIIDRYDVTAIHIATAYWHEWVDLMLATGCTVPRSLRLVIATGEKVSVQHYHRWQSICTHNVMWCNAYGPTETTVTATVFIPDASFRDKHMPIGKPLKGYEAFILDDLNRPLGVGETGQLFIGGPALARGYLNRPEKNAAAFLSVDLPGRGRTRLYRTGDLARWLPSGDIEYAGRVDHQMKIGSYRIEPGEIEAAIAKFPSVLESVVVCDELEGQKTLIAYVATGDDALDSKALQAFLKNRLPQYMVPARYVGLVSLPKTMNGKIDRASLPAPSAQLVGSESFDPCSVVEKRMLAIWQDVLRCGEIGPHDDFFALGGSSLLVTRVVAALVKEFGIELPVRDFFANPTLRSSAAYVESLLVRHGSMAKSSVIDNHQQLHERMPLVRAVMIPSGRERLFGVHYQPRQQSRSHAVLICNSIGHEQVRAYRNLQQLALLLAGKGYDVLRFDYQGTGNSTGESAMATAGVFIDNVRTAADCLRRASGQAALSLIGIRMGALFAMQAKLQGVTQALLWDPVMQGTTFVDLLKRFHHETLTNQTRFAKRVKTTDHPQLYGWQTSDLALASLQSLKIDPSSALSNQLTVIASEGYLDDGPELACSLADRVVRTTDQIGWHSLSYAERAFASPHAFGVIGRVLEQRDSSRVLPVFPAIALPMDVPVAGGTN